MVALELLLMVPVVTVKVAEMAEAATVTDVGVINAALLSDNVTLAAPVGAAWVRVTVQVLEEPDPRLLGLHDNVETRTAAVRFTVVLAELLL